MGVFVWTLGDVIAVVSICILLLMWLGLFVVAVVAGIVERIRGRKSDEQQKEETHENNTGTS